MDRETSMGLSGTRPPGQEKKPAKIAGPRCHDVGGPVRIIRYLGPRVNIRDHKAPINSAGHPSCVAFRAEYHIVGGMESRGDLKIEPALADLALIPGVPFSTPKKVAINPPDPTPIPWGFGGLWWWALLHLYDRALVGLPDFPSVVVVHQNGISSSSAGAAAR